MIFPENIGEHLSIDEVALSQGELYTFLTNKKGTLVASIQGAQSKDIIKVLKMIPIQLRNGVKEVTLDMARNMEAAVKEAFGNASLVTDRFHVVKCRSACENKAEMEGIGYRKRGYRASQKRRCKISASNAREW